MDWGELGSLIEAGWEVGSHTRTHPRLPEVGDEQLVDELAGSRRDCEEGLGRPCATLAYPYGAVDDRVVRAAGEAGYRFAVTLPRGLHKPAPLHWPRVGIYHVDDGWRFRLKVSPAVRAIRGSALWNAVDGPRRAAVRR